MQYVHHFSAASASPAPAPFRTAALAKRCSAFSDLLQTLQEAGPAPAIVDTSAAFFPWAIGHESSWPMWFVWVGRNHRDVVQALGDVDPVAGTQTSVDCLTRTPTLEWHIQGHAFCADILRLPSLVGTHGITVAALSDMHITVSHFFQDAKFQAAVRATVQDGGPSYSPTEEFGPAELEAALQRSVIMGNVPECDSEGRQLHMLKHYAYRKVASA